MAVGARDGGAEHRLIERLVTQHCRPVEHQSVGGFNGRQRGQGIDRGWHEPFPVLISSTLARRLRRFQRHLAEERRGWIVMAWVLGQVVSQKLSSRGRQGHPATAALGLRRVVGQCSADRYDGALDMQHAGLRLRIWIDREFRYLHIADLQSRQFAGPQARPRGHAATWTITL